MNSIKLNGIGMTSERTRRRLIQRLGDKFEQHTLEQVRFVPLVAGATE